ncbi:hypothetical protein [Luteibacter sp.]|uniref:hypothetical protein n=1 Tax=Luteibacter sp. TaxID=1886636 RepID=UPI0028070DC7|nr:hypothetical protein [Luteibacter sp.]MDQ8050717.1 hypothetical protein [Luteibacter sp.]
MPSRQSATLGEATRALCDNRELYFAQSAATRNGYVPRISPWRSSPACVRVAIESHPLNDHDQDARHD